MDTPTFDPVTEANSLFMNSSLSVEDNLFEEFNQEREAVEETSALEGIGLQELEGIEVVEQRPEEETVTESSEFQQREQERDVSETSDFGGVELEELIGVEQVEESLEVEQVTESSAASANSSYDTTSPEEKACCSKSKKRGVKRKFEKGFSRRESGVNLSAMVEIVTSDTKDPKRCFVCGLTADNFTLLSKHMNSHLGYKSRIYASCIMNAAVSIIGDVGIEGGKSEQWLDEKVHKFLGLCADFYHEASKKPKKD